MSERISSFLILLGGTLVILALWAVSVMAVRWDTRRRQITDLERRAWVAISVALPLFGFALYLFMRVLRRYLTPQQEPDPLQNARMTYVRPRQPEPAYGSYPQAGNPASQAPYQQSPATVPAPYHSVPVTYALEVLEGPHLGQQFILNRLPARIGRGAESAIPLDADLNVSRRHAEIYEWNGTLRIRDLQSTHGTLVNGSAVTDQTLTPGDQIMTGSTVFVLREMPGAFPGNYS